MKSLYSSVLLSCLLSTKAFAGVPGQTFLDHCRDLSRMQPIPSGETESIREVVKVMKNVFGNKEGCDASAEALLNSTSLDLLFANTDDLRVFSDLPALKKLWLKGDNLSHLASLSESKALEDLLISAHKLDSLEGLRGLNALKNLAVTGGAFSDLNALQGTSLEFLHVESSELTDISAIHDMSSLSSLNIRSDKLEVLSFGNATQIKTLWVQSNVLSDASSLTNLTDLEEVYISAPNLKNFLFLKSLPKLKSLTVSDCSFNDLSELTEMAAQTSLDSLQLINCSIKDPSKVAEFTNLRSLTLRGSGLKNLRFLQNIKTLKQLDLAGNSEIDASTLVSQSALEELNLNGVSNLDSLALGDVSSLKKFSASSSNLKDLSLIKDAKQLEFLDVSYNAISSETELLIPMNVKYLIADNNPLNGNISFLRGMNNLEVLSLNSVGLSDTSDFAPINKITHISVAGNNLTSEVKLLAYPNLEYVNAVDNKIASFNKLLMNIDSPNEAFTPLVWLKELKTDRNPGAIASFFPSDRVISILSGYAKDISKDLERSIDDYSDLALLPDRSQQIIMQVECLRLQMHFDTIAEYRAIIKRWNPTADVNTFLDNAAIEGQAPVASLSFLKLTDKECPDLTASIKELPDYKEILKIARTKILPREAKNHPDMALSDKSLIDHLYGKEDSLLAIVSTADNARKNLDVLKTVSYQKMMALRDQASDFLAKTEKMRLSQIMTLQDIRTALMDGITKAEGQ
ncbi:MAG: hypothetical protein EOP04_04220 [Proteobacteria bacterium]|nr:MAG: hypothetical protein EOP04_04220 [Pseudomonadota bacterium]